MILTNSIHLPKNVWKIEARDFSKKKTFMMTFVKRYSVLNSSRLPVLKYTRLPKGASLKVCKAAKMCPTEYCLCKTYFLLKKHFPSYVVLWEIQGSRGVQFIIWRPSMPKLLLWKQKVVRAWSTALPRLCKFSSTQMLLFLPQQPR